MLSLAGNLFKKNSSTHSLCWSTQCSVKKDKGDSMNIVFLDVDGVLTYSNYKNDETADIDIEKVRLLKEICDKSNAKVVISSSWRGSESYTPKMYYVLTKILTGSGIDVIGNTPFLSTKFKDKGESKTVSLNDILNTKLKYGTGRAAEVQKWINDHGINNFVILDDEDWDWSDYGYEKNWIRPTWFEDGGLKSENVDKAIKILNGEQT